MDPHFSRSEPECRAPTYPQEILAKLHACAALARKIGATAIACTGDFLHRKGRVTPGEINDLLAVISGWRSSGLDVLGILGNHDAPMGPDSMDSRAAGALHHSRALHLLDLAPAWVDPIGSGGPIYVTGTSYFHGCDRDDEARLRMYGAPPPAGWSPSAGEAQPSSDALTYERGVHVHLAHGALVLRGSFVEDFSTPEQLVPLLAAAGRLPDVIVCGHLHFPEPVVRIPRPDGRGDVAFCRIGSLGRVSRDDLERIPAALAIATEGRHYALKVVPVGAPVARPDLPAEDPRDPKQHEERIKEFARRLREEAETLSLADNEQLVREIAERLGFGERVTLRALQAIDAAGSDKRR